MTEFPSCPINPANPQNDPRLAGYDPDFEPSDEQLMHDLAKGLEEVKADRKRQGKYTGHLN